MKLFRNPFKTSNENNAPNVDFSSLFISMGQGQRLFNQLKVMCHPDKFAGKEEERLAEELFKLIQENCTDYGKLLSIKERVVKELYHGQTIVL